MGNEANGNDLVGVFDSVMGLNQPSPAPVTPSTEAPKIETPAAQAAATQPADDEIEFEGKKYKVDKAPKDILLEMLNVKKGMRKFQAERDAANKKFKDREPDLVRMDQISSALKAKGFEGLYDAITGKEGAFQEYEKKLTDRALKKYNATEDELRLIQSEERADKERELRDMAERTTRETLDKIQNEKDSAAKEILSGRLTEAFEAVDFEGKIGDAEQEQEFNEYVWEKARTKLKQYAEAKGIQHYEIPTKVIKSTFVDIASRLDKTITDRVNTAIPKQAQKASDAATLAAQAQAIGNTSSGGKSANTLDGKYEAAKGNWSNFVDSLWK